MTTTATDNLAQAVAVELGPEWAYSALARTITRPDGAGVYFSVLADKRVHVGGERPAGTSYGIGDNPPDGITVALGRGPRVIALEITRRYLLDYLSWYANAARRLAETQAVEAARHALLSELAAILGVAASKPGRDQQVYAHLLRPGSSLAVVTGSYDGTVNIKINSATPELARAILRIIREHARKEAPHE